MEMKDKASADGGATPPGTTPPASTPADLGPADVAPPCNGDAPPAESVASQSEAPPQPESEGFAGTIVNHLQSVAEPVANVVGPMATALGNVIEAASQAMSGPAELAGWIHRVVSPDPLANLYEVHPEARMASPRELGLRFIPLDEIKGTAVAGHAQRGTDFLPLRQYRGENWQARWQRIRDANERLRPLPPVDLVKFGPDYWVVDGHNRVGAALAYNGTGVDAMVTELVPLDGQISERPTHLLSLMGESLELRAAAEGHRPAMGMRYAEQGAAQEPEASELPGGAPQSGQNPE